MNKFYRVTGTAVAALTLAASAAASSAPYAAARATAPHAAAAAAASAPAPHPMIPAGPAGQAGPNAIGNVPTAKSTNWAGYAVGRTGVRFRKIRATFFVPFLNCAASPTPSGKPGTFSSHWVGLDGAVSKTVEQAGIEADCIGGTPHYFAWREVFPKAEQQFSLSIHPGDSITASVSFSRSTHKFRLEVKDNTTGSHATTHQRCAATTCKRNSAEAISEAPFVNGSQSALADYGALSFAGISITSNVGRGGIRSSHWNRVRIIQVGLDTGHIIARPTALHGPAFDAYWLGEI